MLCFEVMRQVRGDLIELDKKGAARLCRKLRLYP